MEERETKNHEEERKQKETDPHAVVNMNVRNWGWRDGLVAKITHCSPRERGWWVWLLVSIWYLTAVYSYRSREASLFI